MRLYGIHFQAALQGILSGVKKESPDAQKLWVPEEEAPPGECGGHLHPRVLFLCACSISHSLGMPSQLEAVRHLLRHVQHLAQCLPEEDARKMLAE